MSRDVFQRLAERWASESRGQYRAAEKMQPGIERKLATAHATTREALANELLRVVNGIRNG